MNSKPRPKNENLVLLGVFLEISEEHLCHFQRRVLPSPPPRGRGGGGYFIQPKTSTGAHKYFESSRVLDMAMDDSEFKIIENKI